MAQYTIAQYKALYGTSGTEFPDNTSALITPEVMRQFGEDTADSLIPSTSSQLTFVTRTLTRAEILALNSTPITILPAPGASSFYLVKSIFSYYEVGGDTYSSGGGAIVFQYTTNPYNIGTFPSTYIENISDSIAWTPNFTSTGTSVSATYLLNSPVRVTHTVGNPTATGIDTTGIKFIVEYIIINV